jgi:hypothetical protein
MTGLFAIVRFKTEDYSLFQLLSDFGLWLLAGFVVAISTRLLKNYFHRRTTESLDQ